MALIDSFPQPLLDDLVEGRWLPVVGAGFSRNAIVASGGVLPLWDELGRQIADDLTDYPYTTPLDSLSAYQHEYSRPTLVERLMAALAIDDARPGPAHEAFVRLPFNLVCTTNFDFLLEAAYANTPRRCHPILDQDQLPISRSGSQVDLLKIHGDLHHPSRLVVTEEDYDLFIERYPLLATYVSSLLVTRTAVFLGYSLEDPDFRHLWQVVGERLGPSRRQAYALTVDAKSAEVARFARRGVKLISLPGKRAEIGRILADAFKALKKYVDRHVIQASDVTDEESLWELSLPLDASTRLCFFAMPVSLEPFYREYVFPLAEQHGLVSVAATDVIEPGENVWGKIEGLIERAAVIVVDLASETTGAELRLALRQGTRRVIAVIEEGLEVSETSQALVYVARSGDPYEDPTRLLRGLDQWFEQFAAELAPRLRAEPQRLFEAREYRAAVVSAMTLLETALRERLGKEIRPDSERFLSLHSIIDLAIQRELLEPTEREQLAEWRTARNRVVHSDAKVTRAIARHIIEGVLALVDRLG